MRGVWYPGYWQPRAVAPVNYVYVPGWWDSDIYVEGYYRTQDRGSDWYWQDGYYLDDGVYVRGHWVPTSPPPQGYTWEAGFWDGESWVEGFWRPEYRSGFTWVSSYYDLEGVYHGGYWMPIQDVYGQSWIPGWFDGNEWVTGYWIDDSDLSGDAISSWAPDDGWDAGWEVGSGWGDGEVVLNESTGGDVPLGLPVVIPEE
jgi:hypothetical protein